MSDLSSSNREDSVCSSVKMKLSGTRWEYPIPKSKEHWQKFCDDEEKRLTVVRDPLIQFSYRSFPKNSFVDAKLANLSTHGARTASNFHSFLDSSGSKVSENSLHKLSPLKSKFNPSGDQRNGGELFRKSRLPPRASSKSPATSCNLSAASKVARIPKLDTPGPQPSFARISRGKVDHIRAPFGVRNEPKARGKSSPTSPSTLPILSAFPALPTTESKKSRKFERSKSQQRKVSSEPESVAPPENYLQNELEAGKNAQTSLQDQDSLKYSVRCAYKALKRLTADKKLNFQPESIVRSSKESLSGSSHDSFASDDGKRGLLKSKAVRDPKRDDEESERDLEITLKDSRFANTDVERATLKSEETKTIPSASRSTSGPSLEFVHPEPWQGPSSRILESIPKLSGFPRKHRDRCLACMCKSFEAPLQRKVSFPMTALQRIINPQDTSSSHSASSSESSSISVPNFEDEMKRILNTEVESKGVTFDEQLDVLEDRDVEETASSSQEKRGEMAETTEQRSVLDSEVTRKAITGRDEGDDATSQVKNPNDAAGSTRVGCLDGSKVSISFHAGSSEEDDSVSVSAGVDQSKPEFLAPCHAPTVFRPSLEPLRALRSRRPTTLQDRIALTETKAVTSVHDHEDVQEGPKPASKGVVNETKAGGGKEGAPTVSRTLTKAKSMAEGLTLENAGLKREGTRLRKGTSFQNFAVPGDAALESFRDASKDALRGLNSGGDNGFSKTTNVTNSSGTEAKLSLTRTDEVVEFLENLGEDASSTSMLDSLCKEFLERLSKDADSGEGSNKEAATLTRLLVDSKRYLHPEKFPSDLRFTANQPPPCNPRLLRRILPQKSYNLVAPLLGLPEWHPRKRTVFDDQPIGRKSNREAGTNDNDSLASLEVHPPSPRDIESIRDEEKVGQRRYNPYALFLKKPRRKVITWRPLTKADLEGYDPDATLKMRADNIMSKICHDFCQWLDSLGGTDKTVDEDVLRDMFEIDFNAEACRAMQVSIQEMPVVPPMVALTRNTPGASKLAMSRKHVMRDVKAEQTPAKTKAFGATLPWELQFIPPRNQVEKNWLKCKHVPRDLERMDVVWKDITHLKSVRGFVEWLQKHPEVPPPEALKTIVSMDIQALRQIEDDEAFAHLELDIYQIKSLRVLATDTV